MNKIISIVLVLFLFISGATLFVSAEDSVDTPIVYLFGEKQAIVGTEYYVSLNVDERTTNDIIGGISCDIKYDKTKFEFKRVEISKKFADANKITQETAYKTINASIEGTINIVLLQCKADAAKNKWLTLVFDVKDGAQSNGSWFNIENVNTSDSKGTKLISNNLYVDVTSNVFDAMVNVNGASIKKDGSGNIRFEAKVIDKSNIDEVGFLMLPTAALNNGDLKFTNDHIKDDGTKSNYHLYTMANGRKISIASNGTSISKVGDNNKIYCYLTNTLNYDLTMSFSARAYVKMKDGTYLYSDNIITDNDVTHGTSSKSCVEVAKSIYEFCKNDWEFSEEVKSIYLIDSSLWTIDQYKIVVDALSKVNNELFQRPVIYLSNNGNDNNNGDDESAPVATLNRAIEQVSDGGIIYIIDTYTVDDSAKWYPHYKNIKICGGTLDVTPLSTFIMYDSITFDDIELRLNDGTYIYANGFELTINKNVDVNGTHYIYGGSTTDVRSTSLNIYSGSYKYIFGGGNGANVTGDTNVVVGANVNYSLNVNDHAAGFYIFAGGKNGVVGGNTNLTINDNVKSTHIFGAGEGSKSNVLGKTNVIINDGAFMSAYAGSKDGMCSNSELTMFGGEIQQVFGGCEKTSMEGNTRLNILGGTITRRIYGGCYNELVKDGLLSYKWVSENHVNGTTTLYLSSNANVTYSYKDEDNLSPDCAIFACSRYSSHFQNENSIIIFENSEAQSKFNGLLGQQDSLTKLISDWPEPSKSISIKE